MSGIYSRRLAWSEPDVPVNEKLRSKVIEEYAFDTPPKDNLSCFVQSLASSFATITRCQIVCLSIVKDDKQFFYARRGLDAPETSRSVSFCAHAINKPQEPLIVLNALKDSRFAANPLVLGEPNIKFYYGVPLVNMEGVVLGALCINDKPSQLRPEQEAAFNLMAKMCVCQLELVRIFRLAKFDDDCNRNKRAKTMKHIRTTIEATYHYCRRQIRYCVYTWRAQAPYTMISRRCCGK
ncbi:hypothetical protein SARC_06535 [Sphaeroforma arctica JP610]|uniref:GAF domain-containing protein n=1 Tax=Sphaeroforma arctica JP610 TaxID=667725 RepID=A0A0L0FWA9_9EUKA|nr:hypothetical protein SARC_06535 [Sphaeroforma arctica JP610]KNC81110.1 hypothetical protein SARC_06535 [Sphaeroforma arctica JP610]|eukprot:XP_014155012.1 hypothetical protein SARC_06535 [Sphaeroforma arctica JP610]